MIDTRFSTPSTFLLAISAIILSLLSTATDAQTQTNPDIQADQTTVTPGLGNPQVHMLTESVYAITGLYHVAGPLGGVSAGIIFTGSSVVFIDSGMTIASAEFLWQTAAQRMSGDENLYLILTHNHSDHVFGMRVFEERGAEIIGHRMLSEFLRVHGVGYKEFIVNMMGWDEETGDEILGEVVLSPPDRLIDEDTVLNIDGFEIQLLYTPGHVPSEISIYIPSARALFAGDTIYEGIPPTTRFGGPDEWREWISQLRRLKQLEIDIIIPGHGVLCTKEEIDRNIAYINELL